MPDRFPFVTSENGTRYRIVACYTPPAFDVRDPDDYVCDLAKCSRPATWADDFSQFCAVHEPWPVID